MIKILIFVLPFLFLQSDSFDLRDLRWKQRILCLQGKDDSKIEIQLSKFDKLENELIDRKLKVFVYSNGNYYSWPENGKLKVINHFPENKNEDIGLTLIGLDGGEKWFATEVTNPDKIFDIIDAMPMRLSENKKIRE